MSKKSFTLQDLATLTGASLVGDKTRLITGVADLEEAGASDAAFLANPRYAPALKTTQAGVVILQSHDGQPDHLSYLIHKEPSEAFQKVLSLFHDEEKLKTGFTGIHPTAVVHPTAQIGKNPQIGPYTVIDQHVTIGNNCVIGSHCVISPSCTIGDDCHFYPHVTVREGCTIGNRVIIQPGAVIGSCGFGYLTTAEGKHQKLKQYGNVALEDDVEVGANTTIDRARFKSTIVGKGSKIDNLVQIGHGVELGEDNILVSQSGVAGSTITGRLVILGAKAGIAGHLKLGDQVRVAAMCGVSKSLPTGDYNGIPAQPVQEYNRNAVYLRNIGKYIEIIKKLQKLLPE